MRPVTYKRYLLTVLTVIALFNYVDRWALSVILEDLKFDLQLSDTQLGFLSGIAFAVFYSVMGIPIARWADRGNRVLIIAVTALLWSVCLILCGMVTSFEQLLIVRIGVAVGEAGCIPPAFSLIADYFNRAERPRASAIYGMSAPLSLVVGLFGAGWLNDLYGWRITYMVVASPGVVLAALSLFTLEEPRLNERSRVTAVSAPTNEPTLMEVIATLWRTRAFCHLLLCLSVVYFFGYGIAQWQPTFFIRSHGLTSGQVGTWLAIVIGIGGLIGSYLGGEWATRRAANNERLQLRGTAVMIAIVGVLSTCVYIAPSAPLAFLFIGCSGLAFYTINGPLLATIQGLVPERMRAVAIALMYLVSNLIGMGLGPLATGAMSDAFRSWAGDESLRYALLVLAPGHIWAAWHAWRAGRTVARDLATASIMPQERAGMRDDPEIRMT